MLCPSYVCFITYSEQWSITIPSKAECSHTTPHTPSIPITTWKEKALFAQKPNVCSGGGRTVREAYLQGLVVPAVRSVLQATSAVQHEQGPVAVPGLQTAGLIQTHHTQAGLHQGQRIPVALIWIVGEK